MELYNMNRKSYFITIVQFFVDLCGYQSISISSIFQGSAENDEFIVKKLEEESKKCVQVIFSLYLLVQLIALLIKF